MKKTMIMTGLTFCVAIAAYAQDAAAPAVQTTDAGWCNIEVPATAKIGETVPVKFTLKDIAPGLKLAADLHGRTSGGAYMGMVKWGGAPKAAESGKTIVFNILIVAKPNLGSVHVASHLSPTGEFKDRVKEAKSAEIKIVQ